MSKPEEEKLQQALYRAIDLTGSTADATTAVIKTSTEFGLNPRETEFLVTSYNKAKSFALGNQLDESKRGSVFDLADPDGVKSKLYDQTVKTASDDGEDSVYMPSLDVSKDNPGIMKTAAEKMKTVITEPRSSIPQTVHAVDVADRKILNTCEQICELYPQLCKSVKKTASQNSRMMQEALYDASDEFKKYPGDKVKKVAQRIINGFGEQLGKTALDTMSTITGKEVPEVQKTASHSIFPADRIYQHIATAQKYASKSCRATSLKEDLTKHGAAPADIAETITGKTLGNYPGADIIRNYLGHRDPDKTLEEELPADIFQKLQGLESRKAFMQAVLKNPSLQEYSLEGLQDAFNYAIETNPELISAPRSLSNIMLNNIQQGNIDSIDQLSAKKNISKSDIESRKSKAQAGKVEREEKESLEAQKEQAKKVKQEGLKTQIQPGQYGGAPDLMQALVKGIGKETVKPGYEKITQAVKDKEKQQQDQAKQEQTVKEKERQEKDEAYQELLGKIPLKGYDVRMPHEAGFEKGRVLGLGDISVDIGGTPEKLDPEKWVQLARAQKEGTLGPEGINLISKLNELGRSSGYKPIPVSNIRQELGKVDVDAGVPLGGRSDQFTGLKTEAQSFEDLFTH